MTIKALGPLFFGTSGRGKVTVPAVVAALTCRGGIYGFGIAFRVREGDEVTHGRWFLSSAAIATAIAATASPAFAHEDWFHETSDPSLRGDPFFRPLSFAFVGTMALVTLVAGRQAKTSLNTACLGTDEGRPLRVFGEPVPRKIMDVAPERMESCDGGETEGRSGLVLTTQRDAHTRDEPAVDPEHKGATS